MDVLKISDSKIKIMLSPNDVKRFRLDEEANDYGDKKIRRRVWDILDEVKASSGFDHSTNKLLIQFYPSKDGGAELFVTKLLEISKNSEKSLCRSKDVTVLESKKKIYRFEECHDIVKAARILKDSKSIVKSELFIDGDGFFYLEISERGESKFECICEFAVLLEFADPVSKNMAAYINEHCDKLTNGNALEELSSIKI